MRFAVEKQALHGSLASHLTLKGLDPSAIEQMELGPFFGVTNPTLPIPHVVTGSPETQQGSGTKKKARRSGTKVIVGRDKFKSMAGTAKLQFIDAKADENTGWSLCQWLSCVAYPCHHNCQVLPQLLPVQCRVVPC